jgi:hypothetical protein
MHGLALARQSRAMHVLWTQALVSAVVMTHEVTHGVAGQQSALQVPVQPVTGT